MEITLVVTEWFTRYTDGLRELTLALPEGATAQQASAAGGIPGEEVGFLTVNGLKVDGSHGLQNGDRVKVYTMIVGG